MKKLNTITVIVLLLFFGGVLVVSAQTEKKGNTIRLRNAPETQVVNNSGKTIYNIKVGATSFSKKLRKGSSTGFKNVSIGKNHISVKFNNSSPWIRIGALGKFEKGNNYAVNILYREKSLCATLALRQNTDATYAADRTKRLISKTCASFGDRRIE